MTAIEHALLATFVLWICYQWGRYESKKELIEEAIANTLDVLETNNYIKCRTLENGEKQLLEVVEKTK